MQARDVIATALATAGRVMLAASKRATRTRTSDEFDVRALTPTYRTPIVPSSAPGFDLPGVYAALDAQQVGMFYGPSELAKAMRRDDAIYVARTNRIAPMRCLGVEITPGKGPKASTAASEGEAQFGDDGVAVTQDTMADIDGCLADHGLAIGINNLTPRDDGSRVDVAHTMWPLQWTWYNAAARCLMTRVDPFPSRDVSAYGVDTMPRDTHGDPRLSSSVVPIVHGDGRWTVYRKHEFVPWTQDAAILAGGLVFAAHLLCLRSWGKGADSHGGAKVIGELPEGFDLDTDSPEVQGFLTQLQAIAVGDAPFGVKPFGSKIDLLSNPATMHLVFKDLVENREKAAARIWLGTDAILGSVGGAPGVDISELFRMANSLLQGDLEAIKRGFRQGVIEPWAAINFGDSACAPTRSYLVPDADSAAVATADGDRQTAYLAGVASLKSAGIELTQTMVEDLADAFHAKPIELPATAASRGAQIFAYEIDAGAFTLDEVRANKGFAPMPDGQGAKTSPQLKAEATADATADAAPTPPQGGPTGIA
jgi:hypothetical protein